MLTSLVPAPVALYYSAPEMLPFYTTQSLRRRQHGPSTRLVETRARQHGPCWRVMETGHPSTRAVNSGRQLGPSTRVVETGL